MSVQKIIQESINMNPLEMKEAIAEELRARVALALEAKMKDDDEDEEEDDMKEEVELEENWSKGASSANRSDAIAAVKHQAEADRLRKAANKLGKDNPQHNELMGDHHKAMAKVVKHSFHSGKYPSMAIAKKDYNSHMDQATEYNSAA